MTQIDPKAAEAVSMNDTLASGNPSLKTVLLVVGAAAIGGLILFYRSSLGF
jgi:hypothetical protein